MLPLHLVLVRHGQSEGNLANQRSRRGDNRDFTSEFMNRHGAHLRLTDLGRRQAKYAGDWLRTNGFTSFDRYYVSEYTRTIETAALLGIPDAKWFLDFQLRERDYGLADIQPDNVRKTRFAEYLRLRNQHRFYTPWPEGESMAQVCDRIRTNIIATLHRECSNGRAIIVTHGDVIKAFRAVLERILADRFHELDEEDGVEFRSGNGQIVHYTRVDPLDPSHVLPYMGWVESVNPWDRSYAGHDFREIKRQTFRNDELLAIAERTPRLVSDS